MRVKERREVREGGRVKEGKREKVRSRGRGGGQEEEKKNRRVGGRKVSPSNSFSHSTPGNLGRKDRNESQRHSFGL